MEVVTIEKYDDDEIEIVYPKFKWYTVVICVSQTKFKHYHVDTLEEVHKIIRDCGDYYYHRQKLSLDPYKYIVVTSRYYRDVQGQSLFL